MTVVVVTARAVIKEDGLAKLNDRAKAAGRAERSAADFIERMVADALVDSTLIEERQVVVSEHVTKTAGAVS